MVPESRVKRALKTVKENKEFTVSKPRSKLEAEIWPDNYRV
jgi:hypothetical protein